MTESNQTLIDGFTQRFEDNKGNMNCLKDKHMRVKITLNDARNNRAKCQEVYDESDHKDHRLEPALALFDLYIRDLTNESDVCANRLRKMNSDQCYYADKIALLEGTYCILRQYHPGIPLNHLPLRARTRVVRKGLTLEQAQAHCNDPKTSTAYYFDSYSSEEKCKHKKGYNIKHKRADNYEI